MHQGQSHLLLGLKSFTTKQGLDQTSNSLLRASKTTLIHSNGKMGEGVNVALTAISLILSYAVVLNMLNCKKRKKKKVNTCNWGALWKYLT